MILVPEKFAKENFYQKFEFGNKNREQNVPTSCLYESQAWNEQKIVLFALETVKRHHS